MEIKEIISYYIDDTTNTMEVIFRAIEDQDDELRHDDINLEDIKVFGYDFLPKQSNDITEDDDAYYDKYEDYYDPSEDIDMEDIISFLNEYYLIHQDRIPKSELF